MSQARISEVAESSIRIYVVVLALGVFCSLAIVTTYEWTHPIIESNRMSQRHKAVRELMPKARDVVTFTLDTGGDRLTVVSGEREHELFAGFNSSGELVGVAMVARGMGYQDAIELMYAYAPDTQTLTGIRVLESRETPGLGDRISTDPDFLRNFQSLDVRVGADGSGLQNEIAYVKRGEKSQSWQVDGITGATVSSRAVAEILRRSTSHWVPPVYRLRDRFGQQKTSIEQTNGGSRPVELTSSESPPFDSQGSATLEGSQHAQ